METRVVSARIDAHSHARLARMVKDKRFRSLSMAAAHFIALGLAHDGDEMPATPFDPEELRRIIREELSLVQISSASGSERTEPKNPKLDRILSKTRR